MGKVITCYAGSLPHFSAWVIPIWKSLPPEIRGNFYARGRAADYARSKGIDVTLGKPHGELIMVASYEDHRAVRPSATILVNHGVGMRYLGAEDHPSYSGGRDRERVSLFLCPNDADAEVCRAGGALAAAVGVPYLDRFYAEGRASRNRRPWLDGRKPVVVWSHHADIHVVPETRWAFPEWKDTLIWLARNRDKLPFELVGHAHPRSHHYLANFWRRLGIEFVPDWQDVLDRADLYVTDNSSTLYEAAAIGIPVIALNASFYRRDIHHNLRFWSAIPGLQVDHPSDTLETIYFALTDPPSAKRMRESAVEVAYSGLCDGKATQRAVEAICQIVG